MFSYLPLLLWLAETELGITPVNAIIAGLVFLNTLGIFGLIYHAGQYIGRSDQWKAETDRRLNSLDTIVGALHSQEILQAKMDAVIAGLRDEVSMLRKRSHDLAAILQKHVLIDKKIDVLSEEERVL